MLGTVIEISLIVLAALMFVAQVSPEQAVSNTCRWLCKTTGAENPPKWLLAPDADRVVRHGAQIGLMVLLVAALIHYLDIESMRTGPKLFIAAGWLLLLGGVIWHAARPDGGTAEVASLRAQLAEAQKHPATVAAPVSIVTSPPLRALTSYEIEAKLKAIDGALALLNNDLLAAQNGVSSLVFEAQPRYFKRNENPEAWRNFPRRLEDGRKAFIGGLEKLRDYRNQIPQTPDVAGVMDFPGSDLPGLINSYRGVIEQIDQWSKANNAAAPDNIDLLTDGPRTLVVNAILKVDAWRKDGINKLIEIRKSLAP